MNDVKISDNGFEMLGARFLNNKGGARFLNNKGGYPSGPPVDRFMQLSYEKGKIPED